MNKLVTLVHLALLGIGIGQLLYLLFLCLVGVVFQTPSQMLVVVCYSALMGISSLIYQLKLPLRYRQLLHFSLIFLWVSLMMQTNGWFKEVSFVNFFLEFVVIYLLISFVMFQYEKYQIRKINQKLSEIKNNY